MVYAHTCKVYNRSIDIQGHMSNHVYSTLHAVEEKDVDHTLHSKQSSTSLINVLQMP